MTFVFALNDRVAAHHHKEDVTVIKVPFRARRAVFKAAWRLLVSHRSHHTPSPPATLSHSKELMELFNFNVFSLSFSGQIDANSQHLSFSLWSLLLCFLQHAG